MKYLYFFICFLLIQLQSRGSDPLVKLSNDLDLKRDTVNWINEHTVIRDSVSLNHFSRIDSFNTYGIGYRDVFPLLTLNRNLNIYINVKVRVSAANAKCAIALSVVNGDSTIIWDSKDVLVGKVNEWCSIQVAFEIPANFIVSENKLVVYSWKKDGHAMCDFDNLEIEFRPMVNRNFQPSVAFSHTGNNFISADKIIDGSVFSVKIDTVRKKLLVYSSSGDLLVKDVKFYIEYSKWDGRKSKSVLLENPESIRYSEGKDKSTIYLIFASKIGIVKINLIVSNLSNEIYFENDILFSSDLYLKQASLILSYGVQVEKVFKKNTLIDSLNFKEEYWLEKEGVLFSGKNQNYLTYRNSESSSLQLNTFGSYLLLNLDYDLDHPMLYYPLKKKSASFFIDRSTIFYKKGQTLHGSIKITSIQKDKKLLRVLKNQNGYLSSLIWTEHADFSDIGTQRAVNFGSEEIHSADSAIGGFVGRGIPVTKSVFYANPTGLKNSIKDGRFSDPSISIKGYPEFAAFLNQLHKKNFEICLHTPDPFTTSRIDAENAMQYTQKAFEAVNWIDHGYDNSSVSNREDIACSGLDSTSRFFMADLWEKYGVKYFWNNFYEDFPLYKNTSFYSFFTTPYSGWDDAYPTPEFFRNPINNNFISWRTTFTLDPSDGSLWNYYFDKTRLNDLVFSRGNCILHCYPSRVDSTTGFYSYSGKTLVVNPEFDSILIRLKEYNNAGLIWLTTIKEMLDYKLLLENVVLEQGTGNSLVIFNNNDVAVSGVSFISEAKSISAGEKNIRIKRIGEEIIAILDLAPKEKLKLNLK